MTNLATDVRCAAVDPVWDRRCMKDGGHEGPHQNDEIAGDRVTWGTATEIRAYERGEV